MTQSSKKTVLAAACVLVAAVAAGGWWMHRQQSELAWSVLLDTLGRQKSELQYSEDSYALSSKTLTVKNLKVFAAGGNGATPEGGTEPAGPLVEAGSLSIAGAGYLERQGDTPPVPRFDSLIAEKLSLHPTPSDTVTAESVAVGPSTGRFSLLGLYFSLERGADFSELEKTLELFSISELRLTGLKMEYFPTTGTIPPFTLSIGELILKRLAMKESGPLTAKDLSWETSGDPAIRSGMSHSYFSSVKAEALEIDGCSVSNSWLAIPLEYFLADPGRLEKVNKLYETETFALDGLRLRGVRLVHALLGVKIEGINFAFSQKDGVMEITASVNDLNFGRMMNTVLLSQLPALKAIPDAENIPLSLSCDLVSRQAYGAEPGDASTTMSVRFSDIADLRMAVEGMAKSRGNEMGRVREAWLEGENPYAAAFKAGFYGDVALKSLTYAVTDHKLLDYLYWVVAAMLSSTPEREKQRILDRFENAAPDPQLGDFLTQPALRQFFADSGTLEIRLTAKDGPVPFGWNNREDFSFSGFVITSKHTPRASE